MSACISVHGEFSEHLLDETCTCEVCGVVNIDALQELNAELRAELRRYDAAVLDRFGAYGVHDWQEEQGQTTATMLAVAMEAAALTIADALRATRSGDSRG